MKQKASQERLHNRLSVQTASGRANTKTAWRHLFNIQKMKIFFLIISGGKESCSAKKNRHEN